jgi:hypothetical protein
VIQAEETGQVSRVTSTAEVGGESTMVMEVELMTFQLMECTLGGTSVEHSQYYLLKVLTRPSFSSPLLLPSKLSRYPLVQSRHSQEH